MHRQAHRERRDLVVVDRTKLDWHIRRTSTSQEQFALKMGVSRSTIARMRKGKSVQRSSVHDIADGLDIHIEDLLAESTGVDGNDDATPMPWQHPEWEIVRGTLMPFVPLSNGLVMRVAQVRHRVLPDEYGRGKVFDIGGMPSAVRQQCRDALSRHAAVCRRLGHCPYIARNLTMTASPDQTVWTCVDEWFSADTLQQVVAEGPLTPNRRHSLLSQVADAIRTLHEQKIIARELHPGRILVQEGKRALVTDLELAKLLEVEGSVSDDWQRNHYRAPEVASGESHLQADLYSFAHIYLHAATGQTPEEQVNPVEQLKTILPAGELCDQLAASLSPVWQERPESIATICRLLSQ